MGMDVELLFRTDFYLFRFVRDNLRQSCIRRDLSADADSLSFVVDFRSPEFTPIISPDDDSEDLIRIGLVEIQECWLPLCRIGVTRADHFAANSRGLAEVLLRFWS